jgi:hypothetical protein
MKKWITLITGTFLLSLALLGRGLHSPAWTELQPNDIAFIVGAGDDPPEIHFVCNAPVKCKNQVEILHSFCFFCQGDLMVSRCWDAEPEGSCTESASECGNEQKCDRINNHHPGCLTISTCDVTSCTDQGACTQKDCS